MVYKGSSFVWRTLCALFCGAALSFSQKAGKLTKVKTGDELKAAIDEGVPYVHITNHLDLTALPYSKESQDEPYPDLFRPKGLQSLTVCTVHVKM
jgi:hypothetical protein